MNPDNTESPDRSIPEFHDHRERVACVLGCHFQLCSTLRMDLEERLVLSDDVTDFAQTAKARRWMSRGPCELRHPVDAQAIDALDSTVIWKAAAPGRSTGP